MIQYLLGALPKQWRERFEEMLFTEQDYLERLRLAEDKLVDDYVSETLTAEEREQFEKYYLTSERRRQKVAMALALKKSLTDLSSQSDQAGQADQTDPSRPPTQSEIRSSILLRPPTSGQRLRLGLATLLFQLRTRFRIVALILVLLLLGVSLYLLALFWRSPQTTNPVASPSPSPPQTTPRDNRITLELPPGDLRAGNGELKTLAFSANPLPFFRLKLLLPQPPNYAVWRILLTTPEGAEVVRASGTLEQDQRQQNYVMASLPTRNLPAGKYLVQLQGQASSESFYTVASYAFRLTR